VSISRTSSHTPPSLTLRCRNEEQHCIEAVQVVSSLPDDFGAVHVGTLRVASVVADRRNSVFHVFLPADGPLECPKDLSSTQYRSEFFEKESHMIAEHHTAPESGEPRILVLEALLAARCSWV